MSIQVLIIKLKLMGAGKECFRVEIATDLLLKLNPKVNYHVNEMDGK